VLVRWSRTKPTLPGRYWDIEKYWLIADF